MKRILTVFLMICLVWTACMPALAEDTTEYSDNVYSFRYPSDWSQHTANDGSIILLSPDGNEAVLTFAVVNTIFHFTGDEETDTPTIQNVVSQYQTKNTVLDGSYELAEYGEMRGFRAFGTWKATGQPLQMTILTDDSHMVAFEMIGEQAIALEAGLLESMAFRERTVDVNDEGYALWEGEIYSIRYPSGYNTLEQSTGVAFISPDDPNCMIMSRTYGLGTEYTEEMAPLIAADRLPKSTGLEAEPKMEIIGERNMAVIRGEAKGYPMVFCVTGSGETALAVLFIGTEAVAAAEAVMTSAEIR